MSEQFDIAIVGAGPAGLTAAIYARRAGKKTLILEKSTFGGQITYSPRVENYPGFPVLSGAELADKLVDQALTQGAEIEMETVTGIEGEAGNFTVHCEGCDYKAKAVIIATGSRHRQLGLENEERFTGEGVSYCAVCDGAFYKDMAVAVVGGGNTALQEAVMLSDICKSVVIVQNLPELTGEKMLIADVMKKDNIEVIFSATVTELLGGERFEGIRIKTDTYEKNLQLDGLFVAIGQQPENEPFEALAELDSYGYITAGEDCTLKTQGVFTAGDCRTKSVRQVATAIADGAVAALAACRLVDSLNK